MTTIIDYILDLFRSPDVAASFIADPQGAMRDAGLPNVTAAQLASVAATAAPAGVALGGGDPVVGLQRAVANYHSVASPFSPQTTYAPAFAPQTDFASHNATELASNNDFMSPEQSSGANSQVGGFNLGFGDITLGNKTSNTATDGGVVVGGDNAGDVTTGHGNVIGDGNTANTGTVVADHNSPVTIGAGNHTDVRDSSQHSGGDLINGNEGTIIKDNDMSGGHGGSASAGGGATGGGLLGIGIGNGGNEANAGSGGNGGSIIVTDTSNHSASTTVGGNQTTAGGDLGSGNVSDSSSHVNTHVDSTVVDHTETSTDDHSYSSAIGSNNDTSLASHNDTSLASHDDTSLTAHDTSHDALAFHPF